ncbi:unnamed protein product [Lathyrus sativus]|nr:unnamed protein product [Lathyrus sativus]
MKKFFLVLSRDNSTSSTNLEALKTQHSSERIKVVNYELLEIDLEIRLPISSYHLDIQNEVKEACLRIGRHQAPHDFVYTCPV